MWATSSTAADSPPLNALFEDREVTLSTPALQLLLFKEPLRFELPPADVVDGEWVSRVA